MTNATISRGACPDALAEEVHRRTTAGLLKKFGSNELLRQTIPDAVGQTFMLWLASSTDKTEHPGGQHAYWLIKLATTYMLGNDPCRRRGALHIRSCASWAPHDGDAYAVHYEEVKHEGILRKFYDVSEPIDAEGNLIGAIDAVNAQRRGRKCKTWTAALDALSSRGWSTSQIAVALNVSRQTLDSYHSGRHTPRPNRARAIIALAAKDGPTPPPVTASEAARLRRIVRERKPVASPDESHKKTVRLA